MRWIFFKCRNSLYYVSDSQEKYLLNLIHGFHNTPSKLETNRQKICLILRSTFCVYVFLQKLEVWDKFFVFVVLFNVTTKSSLKILFTTGLFTHTAHPNKISSRQLPIMGSYIVPIFVIMGCTWFLIMCQESIPPSENFFCVSR